MDDSVSYCHHHHPGADGTMRSGVYHLPSSRCVEDSTVIACLPFLAAPDATWSQIRDFLIPTNIRCNIRKVHFGLIFAIGYAFLALIFGAILKMFFFAQNLQDEVCPVSEEMKKLWL